MTQPTASLRSDICPTAVGIGVRLKSESLSDFIGMRTWVESLNSQIRKRLLNIHWFANLAEVRERSEQWRQIYNTIQRHGSLNRQTPEAFAAHARLRSAPPPSVRHEATDHNNDNQPVRLTL